MCGVKTMSDRQWQQPLSPEQIEMLQVQFANAKARIESFWGSPVKPWADNRDV